MTAEDAAVFSSAVSFWHVNIQGLEAHASELAARLRLEKVKPMLICINESFLEPLVHVELEGYSVAARRDRSDGKGRGGVVVYVINEHRESVTDVGNSVENERCWLILHTTNGPFSVCAWYRPPRAGEVDSILNFETEYKEKTKDCLGHIMLGDVNVHSKRWLGHSNGETPEGNELSRVCNDLGLDQLVRDPTRRRDANSSVAYMLDLCLSNVGNTKIRVLPNIADHCVVEATMKFSIPASSKLRREVWCFAKADWDGLRDELAEHDWSFAQVLKPSENAAELTQNVLEIAERFIPKRYITETKSTHPWLDDTVVALVKAKQAAHGTPGERAAAETCSQGMKRAFDKWADCMEIKLASMSRSSRGWWSLANNLQKLKKKQCAIPALKNNNGDWILENNEKAKLLRSTFASKFHVPEAEENAYSSLGLSPPSGSRCEEPVVSNEDAAAVLEALDKDSSTGPDLLPSRILKECSAALAFPVAMLANAILKCGVWPSCWLVHWIVPLFKKGAVFDPRNYRGIHLTAQISKVVERIIGNKIYSYLNDIRAFGANQFAYQKNRGARDLIAYVTLTWLHGFMSKKKFGYLCSDVSGAFDRVRSNILVNKLHALGISSTFVRVIESWLQERTAKVVVGGACSEDLHMSNMIFQGTVLGPMLWNCFYADASIAVQSAEFEEVVFADDLNAMREYKGNIANSKIIADIEKCQSALHAWGRANCVAFDAAKESMHVISRTQATPGSFKLLGVEFDTKLIMENATHSLANECRWKFKSLLRTRRFLSGKHLVDLYKARILSYIEYRTPAIYHASSSLLSAIDKIQERVLEVAGVGEKDALLKMNLAPLNMRRDIAMLGVIHRSILGRGPEHFNKFFTRCNSVAARHSCGIAQYDDGDVSDYMYPNSKGPAEYIQRSALGLCKIYNALPAAIVETSPSVAVFQGKLQELAKSCCNDDVENWQSLFCPRRQWHHHPLRWVC